jgi:Cupredoxin-like domain
MRNLRAAGRLLLIGLGLAALAGCGHTATVGADRTIRVAVTEYRVVPQRIDSPAGQVTLVVENDGRLTHDLAVSRRGVIVGQTPPLQPGTQTDLVLTLSRGSYLMTSTLFSDQALGTYGTLRVR